MSRRRFDARPRAGTPVPDAEPERVVSFRPRTVLQVTGVLLGVAVALWVVFVSRQVITWMFVALFLTLAMNPGVAYLEGRGWRRGLATGAMFLAVIVAIAGLAALLVPPLVDQVSGFVNAVPGYIHDLTKGKGPFGFLERSTTSSRRCSTDSPRAARRSCPAAPVRRSRHAEHRLRRRRRGDDHLPDVFMLLEGPDLVERGLGMMPPASRRALAQRRPRHRAHDLGLRHRQPADLPHRRHLLGGGAARSWACPSRSPSASSSPSST